MFFIIKLSQQEILNKKIINIPLQFQYLPVEILSKQFTKLNNTHQYRIHYLGPRFKNTIELHKKNAYTEQKPFVYNSQLMPMTIKKKNQQLNKCTVKNEKQQIQKYKIDHLKIYNSFFLEVINILLCFFNQEKLKKTQYFKSTIYYRAFQGMNPTLKLQDQFIFNSCFQGGNLDCAIKINPRQFDLFLRIDSNTRGHLLWFYFSVKNNNQTGKIKFNLCNFSKSKTLYKQGMKPYVFSTMKNKQQNKSWEQDGINLGIEKKQLRYEILGNKKNPSNTHCLTIQYKFQYQNDQIFFAYCIPYTYSQLIAEIEQLPKTCVTKSYLGKSLLGTPIPLLHISQCNKNLPYQSVTIQDLQSTTTNMISQNQSKNNKQKNQFKRKFKKIIFITGRMHPSQSNSSYVLMGFIKWLCSQQKQAIDLRKIAEFIIIPMANPDGVILGNSRTSAAGKDLNRQFISPDPSLYPQIYQIKQLARKIHSEHNIQLYLDFHGHSRKKNTFFYGPVYSISQPNYYKSRILPKLIEKISNSFRYHSCSFNIVQEKKRTARAFMFQGLTIPYTYTIQSSIGYFYDSQKLKIFQFTTQQYSKIGQAIAIGTSTFMIGLKQYDQMIEEKRKTRQRSKKNSRYVQTKLQYLQDQMFLQFDKDQTLKLIYSQKEIKSHKKKAQIQQNGTYFMQMLNQLCSENQQKSGHKLNQKYKNNDKLKNKLNQYKQQQIQQESDSHDQKQDMDIKILNQFKYVIKNQESNQPSPEKYKRNTIPIIVNKEKLMNKNVDELQIFQEFKSKNIVQRNIKTGQQKRVFSPRKSHPKPNYRQRTVPQQTIQRIQRRQSNQRRFIKDNLQAAYPNKMFKRSIYTSGSRNVNKQKIQQKTVSKFFGQFQLLIDKDKVDPQQAKKKQQIQIIKKIQNQSRQRSRKQSMYQFKIQENNNQKEEYTNHINNIYMQNGKSKKEGYQKDKILPNQLNLYFPLTQQSLKPQTNDLKPKLKLNLRINKPKSSSSKKFVNQNSLLKQKLQQSFSTIKNINSKLFANETKYIRQNKLDVSYDKRKFYKFQKSSKGKQKQYCTTINLNDVDNSPLIHSSHMKIFQF